MELEDELFGIIHKRIWKINEKRKEENNLPNGRKTLILIEDRDIGKMVKEVLKCVKDIKN